MALAVTNNSVGSAPIDFTHAELIIYGTIVASGNYGGASTHGDTLSFSNIDNIKSNEPPLMVEIFEAPAAGTSQSGYVYAFCPGTTLANGVMQVFQSAGSAAPLVELTEAEAYPAGITGAVIKFRAFFQSL